jgi:hypothetical protein
LLKLCQNWKLFQVLLQKFPHLSEGKLKEGIFVGPNIRKLMFDEDFLLTMAEVEREAWIGFKVLLPSSWGTTRTVTTLLLLQYAREIRSLGVLNELKSTFFEAALVFFP